MNISQILMTDFANSFRGGTTAFSKLSPTAQELIVDAVMGKFEKSGPPPMTDEVRAEIALWASTHET
jgi:hypothetical protein